MITYILTRFSICDYSFKGFQDTTKLTEDEYKAKIFNEDRLNFKFSAFELVTLPSIVNQTSKNFVWCIYTSNSLPEKYKERLLNLVKDYDNIKCKFISSYMEIHNPILVYEFNNNIMPEKYCTIYLDDDDGLSHTYIETLEKYKSEEDKTVISFPLGNKISLENDKIIIGRSIEFKKIGLGLAVIGMNIYRCGNHINVDERYQVIYDYTPNSYLLMCSEFCDTKRKM